MIYFCIMYIKLYAGMNDVQISHAELSHNALFVKGVSHVLTKVGKPRMYLKPE